MRPPFRTKEFSPIIQLYLIQLYLILIHLRPICPGRTGYLFGWTESCPVQCNGALN